MVRREDFLGAGICGSVAIENTQSKGLLAITYRCWNRQWRVVSDSVLEARSIRQGTNLSRGKQIPLCVPRPPTCGGKGKARDRVRDDRCGVLPMTRQPARKISAEAHSTQTEPKDLTQSPQLTREISGGALRFPGRRCGRRRRLGRCRDGCHCRRGTDL